MVKRQVRDTPIVGHSCWIEIELAPVCFSKNSRRMEHCPFVDEGSYYTHRFCRLISGLCLHMSIDVVSRHLSLRWESTQNIDKAYLHNSLPARDRSKLSGLKMIGVDEVARAKGHDYMTVVYDMVESHLIWVKKLIQHWKLKARLKWSSKNRHRIKRNSIYPFQS